jgi:hypothetical protein
VLTEPRPEAVTAASRPILRRLPSLGQDACRSLAYEALSAAQPHLEAGEPQSGLTEKLRAAFDEYGLTPGQVAGVEGLCARLIEAAARRPYPAGKGRAT